MEEFLVLLWAVSAAIVGRAVIRPIIILWAAVVVLLLPLSADVAGVAPGVAMIAVACGSVIAATVLTGAPGSSDDQRAPACIVTSHAISHGIAGTGREPLVLDGTTASER